MKIKLLFGRRLRTPCWKWVLSKNLSAGSVMAR